MDLATDKFDAKRFGLITGSACSVLFPERGNGEVGQRTYAKKLANQMYFKHYDENSTWQTQHGNHNEYAAFEFFKTNYDFGLQLGDFKQIGNYGGTSDALSKHYGVDFKCPTSLDGWLDYLHVGIDKQQYHQAQMYMYLFEKPLWKVAIYLTETKFMEDFNLTYPVPENKRMIIVDVKKEDTWFTDLEINSPFVIRERDKYLKNLESHFGQQAKQ